MAYLAVGGWLCLILFLFVVRPQVNKYLYREYQAECARWAAFHAQWQADLIAMGERWAAEDLALIAGGQDPKGLPYGTQAGTLDAYWEIMKDAPIRVESWETRKAKRWAKQLEAVS